MSSFVVILIVFMVASTVMSAVEDGNRWDKRDGK